MGSVLLSFKENKHFLTLNALKLFWQQLESLLLFIFYFYIFIFYSDGSKLHPGLYPVLMVLGRLFPSVIEGVDSSLNLAAFILSVVK